MLGPIANRLAMSNVFGSLSNAECACVYIMSGRPDGVSLYLGIASDSDNVDLPDASKAIRAAFEGNFLGAHLHQVTEENTAIERLLDDSRHLGTMTGIPTFSDANLRPGEDDFQGIERLVSVMDGETWQLIITARRGSDSEIDVIIQDLLDLSGSLSTRARYSVDESACIDEESDATRRKGTAQVISKRTSQSKESSKGGEHVEQKGEQRKSDTSSASDAESNSDEASRTVDEEKVDSEKNSFRQRIGKLRELQDVRGDLLHAHLRDTVLERFLQGRGKGMFKTAVHVSAQTLAGYERLARTVQALFQGPTANLTPLRIHKMPAPARSLHALMGSRLAPAHAASFRQALVHSVPWHRQRRCAEAASWLGAHELALIAGLPNVELPGMKLRPSTGFALNTTAAGDLVLGLTVQHGRVLAQRPLSLVVRDLNKHVFVTGVTGAGKTTTCMRLLIESKLPFLVIEPAKTEYRALAALDASTEYYILGREDLTPFRLNPFELVRADPVNLAGHVSQLTATLAAVFPMEAAMPYLVEEAIINTYKARGWDVHAGKNYFYPLPWAEGSKAWPTFSDLVAELKTVVNSKGMGEDFTAKYLGSLVAQLSNLTLGVKGRMLNTARSMDFGKLLDRRVVIELEEMKNEQDKALLMGLIIGRIADCMKQRHRSDKEFRHLTLVEEAHRLLSRPEPGDSGARKAGVEMFANLLSEVRKYGEGLIIADQIPNKLIPDVIKNTNTKIVHRLFAADDRHAIGDTMGLSDKQKDFLPLLQQGQAVVYCGGWHAPVLTQVIQGADTSEVAIPDARFQERGNLQLAEQKSLLWPQLAQCGELDGPAQFSAFLRDGTVVLNLLLRLNRDSADIRVAERLRRAFLSHYDLLKCAHGAALDKLLDCLLQDCVQIDFSGFAQGACASWISDAVRALRESVEEFGHVVTLKRPRGLFKFLRDIDNI